MKKYCRKKGRVSILLFLLVSILFVPFFSIQAGTFDNKEIVRVGWYLEAGFQEYDPQGNPCGYAYEYLEKLAEYQDLKIVYVPANYEECKYLLKTNIIDLMFQYPREEQNTTDFFYSDKSIASLGLKLLVHKNNISKAYRDHSNFSAMRIGILRNKNIKLETLAYAEKKNIHFILIEYPSMDQLKSALNENKIDGIVLGPLENAKGYRLLDEFDFSELHLMFEIGRAHV